MPEPDVRDPVGMRDPIRVVQQMEHLLRGKRSFSGDKLDELRGLVENLLSSISSLDLVVEVQGESDELACQLLAIGQAFGRGEGDETDEQGFLKLGDTATELADKLYEYSTEG